MSVTAPTGSLETKAAAVVILPRDAHTVSRSMIDENSLKVLYRLRQHGYIAYLVGGSVRDLLLGRQPKDFDVGTNATPEQVRKLFRNCRLVGRRFRLAHIMFGRNCLIEVATFRRKPQADEIPDDDAGGLLFAENVFGTPQQDAFRRDFTINALFYDIADFSIVDYVGGLADLRAGVIRVIGDPDERFAEDPVRMLRALEFSARLGFKLEESIPDAIGRCAEQMRAAAPARIREEILELFRHKVAGSVIQKADRYRLLEYLLPNLKAGRQTFDLLRQLDLRTASGRRIDEYFALAAMHLEHFTQHIVLDMSIGDVHVLANRLLAGHCRHFSIASGIKHKARELLIAFFRLQRGRGKRGEKRFLHHPATEEALELYSLWCSATNCKRDLLESWQRALDGDEPLVAPKGGKKVRRRRKRKPQQAGQQESGADKPAVAAAAGADADSAPSAG
ncbi:MAG: polynucleotide adenylyltransferase PcnB [Desulfuromonas sp.]|nr:polynucleotide adenylyltransferase PcnB [Desulfuromonas sp.]